MASTIPKPHQTRPTASVCGPEMARLRVMSRSAPVVAGSSVGSLGAAATIRYSTRYCLMWLHIAQHGTTGMQVPRVHVLYRFENRASPERVNDFETCGVRVYCRTAWLSSENGG